MRLFAIVLLIVFLPTYALAEDKPTNQKSPTELEAFLQTKGQIIVKEFHDLGKVSGQYGTGLSVETLILSDPASPSKKRTKGLRIEVKGSGKYDHDRTSFLDLEEIESLTKGLAYMIKLADEWKDKPKEYTEVIFSTKGEFQVGFYQNQGELSAFVKSGNISSTSAVLSLDSLASLKAVSEKGLTYLNSH